MLKCCQLAVFSAFILGLSRSDSKQKDVRHKYLYECWLSRFAYFFVLGWIFFHIQFYFQTWKLFFKWTWHFFCRIFFFCKWNFFEFGFFYSQRMFEPKYFSKGYSWSPHEKFFWVQNFFEFKLKFGQIISQISEKKFDQQIQQLSLLGL